MARVAGWVGLVGAVVATAAFVTWAIADVVHQQNDSFEFNDYGDDTYFAMIGTCLVLALVTTAAPWGSLIGAAGFSGGRAVAWTFLPLALMADVVAVAGNAAATFAGDDFPIPVRIVAGIGIGGAVVAVLALLVAAVAWALPGARDFLHAQRRPGRERRGKVTLVAVAALAGLALVLYGVTIALIVYGGDHIDLTPKNDAYYYGDDDVPAFFLAGIVVAAVLLVTEIVLIAGALVTRFARIAWVRGVAYALAWMTLGGSVPALAYLANLKWIASGNGSGDVAEDAAFTAFFIALTAGLLHLIALLMLAMPSVSAWIATRPPRGPAGAAPGPAAGSGSGGARFHEEGYARRVGG
ncbi:hypothetical protein [Cryptosporangium sp. NPDC048952]|uniref:hypothetical protein n=1 Tax=Cryptosporangium sp. NPDC048952 TaxID=3363961 RepID=UPI0037154DB9